MQANETLLEFWIAALCEELGDLSHAPIVALTAPYEVNRQEAFETLLLARGPVEGELRVTVEAGALVQFTQLSSGEPLDPEVVCNPERIENWRRLLDASATRLSIKLTANFTDSENNQCVVRLAETNLVSNGDPLAGEPGSRTQQWLLQAGQSKIAILARTKVEFLESMAPTSRTSTDAIGDGESVEPIPVHENQSNGTGNQSEGGEAFDATVADAPDTSASSFGQGSAEQDDPDAPSARAGKRRRVPCDFDESADLPERASRFDLMLDIELEATLRFGAIEMPLREVLELGPGDVLSLDRHVQEPVELVVGDRIVARGEVVLIGGNFGLQVTEVAEPRRRLETIRCLF